MGRSPDEILDAYSEDEMWEWNEYIRLRNERQERQMKEAAKR